MKKLLVIFAVISLLLTSAQTKTPMRIGSFEVLAIRQIYRISATFVVGEDGCNAIHYWWIDEWGRPVDTENWELKTVLPDDQIINEYWDFTYPEEDAIPNPFDPFSESGA